MIIFVLFCRFSVYPQLQDVEKSKFWVALYYFCYDSCDYHQAHTHLTRSPFYSIVAFSSLILFTFPARIPGLSSFSILKAEYPRLSEEISWLVMFMLVVWTAYQFMTPWRFPSSLTMRTWLSVSSVLLAYLQKRGKFKWWYFQKPQQGLTRQTS